MTDTLEIFLVVQPGFETALADEARAQGFHVAGTLKGGVTLAGGWADVWRANLCLRGATRVLLRFAEFPALHLAQLDKRARKIAWKDWLRPDVPVRVEASCRKSKIYHDKAARQRVETAIKEELGAPISDTATLTVRLRIDDNRCTFSLDTSGEPLHKRGHKAQVNKAPMRETMAAMFLRQAGFDATQPLYDPMCGSGTFPIEGAEIAGGLAPGRSRDFAFQQLAGFDTRAFEALKSAEHSVPDLQFFGTDRDAGAVKMSKANAERAGVTASTSFQCRPISDATPPSDTPGLVIVNPPYGGRVGNKKPLYGLYASFGAVMKQQFKGWRVAMITADAGLAKTTDLPWQEPGPQIDHGGIRVRLWQTIAL